MGRRASLSGISGHELHRELRRRQRRVGTLGRRRDRLARRLSDLEAEIQGLGGPAGRAGSNGSAGGRTRPKNAMNLVESLAKILDGKTMSVTDVAGVVQKAGYRTTSPSFRTIVNQTLINNDDRFKRVARGQYTAK